MFLSVLNLCQKTCELLSRIGFSSKLLVIGSGNCIVLQLVNLAAHGLASFAQCFRARYVCRVCCCTTDQIQSSEVSEAALNMRRKDCHDRHVQNVVQGENVYHFDALGEFALSKAIQNFYPTTVFPPDILHNLFKGFVPIELALCICVITDRGLKAVFLDCKRRPKHHHVEHYPVFWASCSLMDLGVRRETLLFQKGDT